MGSITSFPLGLEIFTVSTDILDFKTLREKMFAGSLKISQKELKLFLSPFLLLSILLNWNSFCLVFAVCPVLHNLEIFFLLLSNKIQIIYYYNVVSPG